MGRGTSVEWVPPAVVGGGEPDAEGGREADTSAATDVRGAAAGGGVRERLRRRAVRPARRTGKGETKTTQIGGMWAGLVTLRPPKTIAQFEFGARNTQRSRWA